MNNPKPADELKFSCPGCGQHLACEASCAGTVVRCPTCALDITVPSLARIAQPSAAPPKPHAPPLASACPSCGAALPPDAVLCVQCGYNLTGSKVLSTELPARAGTFALLRRPLVWVAAAAAVAIGAFVFRSGSKPPAPPPPSPSVLKAVGGEAGFYDFVVAFHPDLLRFAADGGQKLLFPKIPSRFSIQYISVIRRSQTISVYDSTTMRNRPFDTKSLGAVADALEFYLSKIQRHGYLTPGEFAYLRVPCDEAIAIARGKGAGASMSDRARRRAVVAWLEQEPERVKLWIQAYLNKEGPTRAPPGPGGPKGKGSP